MGMLWVVCGAGRGVGKTTVALKLCEALPRSVYAKYGHGDRKAGKAANFFTRLSELHSFVETARAEHAVVECNPWAIEDRRDVAIFIDGVEGKTRFRADAGALRARSELKVCRDSSSAGWRRALRRRLSSRSLRDAVCDILAEQKRYLFGSRPTACSKVWFEMASSHVFGAGLARLLEDVENSGSLRKAARAADMSYRYAWGLVRRAENHLGCALVEKRAGGRGGGGSSLTTEGRRMVKVFRRLSEETASFADRRFRALYREESGDV